MDGASAAVSSQSLTVSTTAVAATGFTIIPPRAAQLVTFDVQTSDVRVRWDGVDPTSSVGHYLPAYSAYTWDAAQYNAAKFILAGSVTATAVIFASPFTGG